MTSLLSPRPVAVNFHLWPKCNLRCTFCYAGFANARRVLAPEDAERLVRELAAAGTDKITFVGGEPTLHPHLGQLTRVAADLGMTTCIVTNGARLVAVLDAAPGAVHWVGLSVDSGNEQTQAALGRGTGDHVSNSIQIATEIRRRGIRLKLNTVVRDWKTISRSLSHQDGAASRTFGPRAGDPRSKQTGRRND